MQRTSRTLRNLTLGLAEKKRRSARHSTQLRSSRLPRTHSTVQHGLLIWRWFTRGRASATARSSNSKKLRPFPDWHRHTVIFASIHAGMICAVMRVSTKLLPQPRLPANSSSPTPSAVPSWYLSGTSLYLTAITPALLRRIRWGLLRNDPRFQKTRCLRIAENGLLFFFRLRLALHVAADSS